MHKNINKIIIAFLIVLACKNMQAQSDSISDIGQADFLHGATSVTEPKDRLIALNDLLKSGRINNEQYIAELYTRLAETTVELNSEILQKDAYQLPISEECKSIFDLVNAYYKKAFDTCEFCAPKTILSRYKLQKSYPCFEERAEKDIALLKSYGYKEEIQSVPLGFSYTKTPVSEFIGVELSLVSMFSQRYKMKNFNKKTGKIEVIDANPAPTNYQSLTCGINSDTRRAGYEVWFSFGQMTSPIFFNPMKIGFTENFDSNEKTHWFYRPGIGLGWGIFSANCDYNMALKKSFRQKDNGLCFTFRICFPWLRFN